MKKIIVPATIIVFGLIISLFQWNNIGKIKQIIFNENTKGKNKIVFDSIKNYETVLCNWNIFKPQIAYVEYFKNDNFEDLGISFYNFQKEYYLFGKWNFEYTGGATVKNTTFPELLKMVKEDCYQFQKTFYQGDDNKLWWTYSKAFKKKIKTKEEIEREKKEDEEYDRQVKSGEIKVDTRSIDEIMEDIQ